MIPTTNEVSLGSTSSVKIDNHLSITNKRINTKSFAKLDRKQSKNAKKFTCKSKNVVKKVSTSGSKYQAHGNAIILLKFCNHRHHTHP